MAVSIPSKDEIYSDNIVLGHAELVAVYKKGKLNWALPGGGYTTSRPFAMTYARRLNKLIKVNMERFNRSLLWS